MLFPIIYTYTLARGFFCLTVNGLSSLLLSWRSSKQTARLHVFSVNKRTLFLFKILSTHSYIKSIEYYICVYEFVVNLLLMNLSVVINFCKGGFQLSSAVLNL